MLIKNKILIIVLIVLSVIPILSLLHPGFPVTHDGQDHVARIANFYQNLVQGNLIPRWAPNLNWGYGHPILEFLYPLPSYIASGFHLLGFSLMDSTKIVFILGMVLSTLFMYLWLSQFFSKYAALFGAVLYTYAPYRFIETYVRGDIGENLGFAFIPLVLFFIYKLYKQRNYKYVFGGSFSLAFLILAHNAMALMFVSFIFLYCAYLVYLSKHKRSLIINLSLLIIFGFALSAFFWLPALLEGKYTLRNIVTKGGYLTKFVSFPSLIYGPWNFGQAGQFSVQFGILSWVSLILSPFTIFHFKKDKEKLLLAVLLLIFSLISTFLMLRESNFIWSNIMLLQNFQFPWRFLAIIVFSTAVLGAILFEVLAKFFNPKILITLTIVVTLFISSFYWYPKGYQYKPESFYTGIYNSTTDTGESAPIWSVRFMEKRPKAHLEVLDGKATVKEISRTSTTHIYSLIVDKKTLFAENTLYFPGWEIKANGVPVAIEFQNMQYRGIMLFSLEKRSYIIEVKYSETRLRKISDLLSGLSLAALIGLAAFLFVKK